MVMVFNMYYTELINPYFRYICIFLLFETILLCSRLELAFIL